MLADANILLRLLLRDDPAQVRAVERRVEKAARARRGFQLHILAIAETVWILQAKGWTRENIVDALLEVCESSAFEVLDRDLVRAALAFYLEGNASFVDAFQAAYVTRQGIPVLSFDRDYDALGVSRIDP